MLAALIKQPEPSTRRAGTRATTRRSTRRPRSGALELRDRRHDRPRAGWTAGQAAAPDRVPDQDAQEAQRQGRRGRLRHQHAVRQRDQLRRAGDAGHEALHRHRRRGHRDQAALRAGARPRAATGSPPPSTPKVQKAALEAAQRADQGLATERPAEEPDGGRWCRSTRRTAGCSPTTAATTAPAPTTPARTTTTAVDQRRALAGLDASRSTPWPRRWRPASPSSPAGRARRSPRRATKFKVSNAGRGRRRRCGNILHPARCRR